MQRLKVAKILAALVAALSILNSSGASPGATKNVTALVERATCSCASHSSDHESGITVLYDLQAGSCTISLENNSTL